MADPYGYFCRLRDEDPVHWNEKYEVWLITRYDDLVWLTRNDALFSASDIKKDPRPPYPAVAESDVELAKWVGDYLSEQFIQYDPPIHRDMRKVLQSYFSPRAMEAWRPRARSAIKELLDAAEDKGEMDVVRDLATPLPVLVISDMMGVPPSDRDYVRRIAEKLLYIGRGESDRMKILSEGLREIDEYVAPMIEERMVNPADDYLSALAEGEKQGVYTRRQVLVNAASLLLAGHETTINLIGNGTLAFLDHPAEWARFKADPDKLAKLATEECLRYDSPVKSMTRIADQDVEMRGKTLRKYDRVRWFMSSANRDPEQFRDPDTFDITRHPNQHIAFGSGSHHCIGAALARIEGQEAFKALAARFPDMRRDADTLEYSPTITFRALKSLPVVLP
jgi:cytochrome P450